MHLNPHTVLSIGTVEKQFGVTQRALRFYEQKAFITPKRQGKHRYYDHETLQRLEMILFCKGCGLSIDDIGLFFAIMDGDQDDHAKADQLADIFDQHLDHMKNKKAEISNQIDAVETCLTNLYSGSTEMMRSRFRKEEPAQNSNIHYLR